jgi:hypothetical protein
VLGYPEGGALDILASSRVRDYLRFRIDDVNPIKSPLAYPRAQGVNPESEDSPQHHSRAEKHRRARAHCKKSHFSSHPLVLPRWAYYPRRPCPRPTSQTAISPTHPYPLPRRHRQRPIRLIQSRSHNNPQHFPLEIKTFPPPNLLSTTNQHYLVVKPSSTPSPPLYSRVHSERRHITSPPSSPNTPGNPHRLFFSLL